MSLSADTWMIGAKPQSELGTTFSTEPRLYRWTGAPPIASPCGAGLAADGVYFGKWIETVNGSPVTRPAQFGMAACRGLAFRVEVGAVITAGQELQSDSVGRVVPRTSGVLVARALESGGLNAVIWCVFA